MDLELNRKRIVLARMIRIQTDLAEISAIISLATSRIERVWQHEDNFLDDTTNDQIADIELTLIKLKAATTETFIG